MTRIKIHRSFSVRTFLIFALLIFGCTTQLSNGCAGPPSPSSVATANTDGSVTLGPDGNIIFRVSARAGSDKEVFENELVLLDGSGSDVANARPLPAAPVEQIPPQRELAAHPVTPFTPGERSETPTNLTEFPRFVGAMGKVVNTNTGPLEMTYQWTQVFGPTVTISGADQSVAEFTAPVVEQDTDLVFRLTASAGEATSQDSVAVRVLNSLGTASVGPIADPGPNQTVTESDVVTLDGSNSTGMGSGSLTYDWMQVSGTTVRLINPSQAVTTFRAPMVRGAIDQLTFELVVTEGGSSTSGQVTVTVMPVSNQAGGSLGGGNSGGGSGPPECVVDADCSDGVDCTVDWCSQATSSCNHVSDDSACDNGAYCDGTETCHPALGCQAGANPCPAQTCVEATDTCQSIGCGVDGDCDDGLWCNGLETCGGGNTCLPGTPVNCDDSVSCTVDSCVEATQSCQNTPNDSLCDNQLFCDGSESCDVSLGCQSGSDPCLNQLCDDVLNQCVSVDCTVDNDCDDGFFCNGPETCQSGTCAGGLDPCVAGETCDEINDGCVVSGDAVSSFVLIDADLDSPMAGFEILVEGATLNLATLPTQNLNIEAKTNPATVGSVRFALDGNSNFRTENSAPYALAGDSSGDFSAWTPSVGTHNLTATPYSGSGAGGTAGTPLAITFEVIDQSCNPAADSDGDGVNDCDDGCPNDANKTAPGVCGCGVADAGDSDGDGVLNCVDQCPGGPDTDSDGDGVPDCNDQCPGAPDADTDGDGLLDCNDGCPNDANKSAPGVCGCGVADTDSDGDGTLDCNDGCPSDPNKTSPGVCGCNRSDVDANGNGIPDGCEVETTNSITQWGITWTFDGQYEFGQFVNGDYWVVGPVTITSVSPGWDGQRNGAMLDPVILPGDGQGQTQGYDNQQPRSGIMPFSESKRTSFPATISPGIPGASSLISVISRNSIASGGSHQFLSTAAVLTVVNAPLPPGTFRPPYMGGPKPMYMVSQVDYTQVPGPFPVPPGVSLPNTTASHMMKRVWLDHGPFGQAGGSLHPEQNLRPYSRDSSVDVSSISLMMMLNTAEREELINRMIQVGIDTYHVSVQNRTGYKAIGGFGNGRKWPILFAGILLNDQNLVSPQLYVPGSTTVFKFGEDGDTFYGQPNANYPSGKPLFGIICNYNNGNYCPSPTTGDKDCRDPNGIGDACGYRKCCTSHTWVGQALAARMMNAKALWNHDDYFDYVDRWILERSAAAPGEVMLTYGNSFIRAMWDTYRADYP